MCLWSAHGIQGVPRGWAWLRVQKSMCVRAPPPKTFTEFSEREEIKGSRFLWFSLTVLLEVCSLQDISGLCMMIEVSREESFRHLGNVPN